MQVSTKDVPREPVKQKHIEVAGFSSKVKPTNFAFVREPKYTQPTYFADLNYSIIREDNISEKYKQLRKISNEKQQGIKANFRLPKMVDKTNPSNIVGRTNPSNIVGRTIPSNIVSRTNPSKSVERDQLSSVLHLKQSQRKSIANNFSPLTQAIYANRALQEEAKYWSTDGTTNKTLQEGKSSSISENLDISPLTQAIYANRAQPEEEVRLLSTTGSTNHKGKSNSTSTSENSNIGPYILPINANRTRALREETRYWSTPTGTTNHKEKSSSTSENLDIRPHTLAINDNRAQAEEEVRLLSTTGSTNHKGKSNSTSTSENFTSSHTLANPALQEEEARYLFIDSTNHKEKSNSTSTSENLDISLHTLAMNANPALQEEEARYLSTGSNQKLHKGKANRTSTSENSNISPHALARNANRAPLEASPWSTGKTNHKSLKQQSKTADNEIEQDVEISHTANQKLHKGKANRTSTSENSNISPHALARNANRAPLEASPWSTGITNHKSLKQPSKTADNEIEQDVEISHTATLGDSNFIQKQESLSQPQYTLQKPTAALYGEKQEKTRSLSQPQYTLQKPTAALYGEKQEKTRSLSQPQYTLEEPMALYGTTAAGNTTKPSQTTRKSANNIVANAFNQDLNVQQGRNEFQKNRGFRQKLKWPPQQKLSQDKSNEKKSAKNTEQKTLYNNSNFIQNPEETMQPQRKNQIHGPQFLQEELPMALYGATLTGNTTNPLQHNPKKPTIIVNPVEQEFNLKPSRREPQKTPERLKSKWPEESPQVAASTSDHTSSSFTKIPNHRSSLTNPNTQRLHRFQNDETHKKNNGQSIVNNTLTMDIKPKESLSNNSKDNIANKIRNSSIDSDRGRRFSYGSQRNSITTPIEKDGSNTKQFLAPCILVNAQQSQENNLLSSSSNWNSRASFSGELGPIQTRDSSPGELVQAGDSYSEGLIPMQARDSTEEGLRLLQAKDSSEELGSIQARDSYSEGLESSDTGNKPLQEVVTDLVQQLVEPPCDPEAQAEHSIHSGLADTKEEEEYWLDFEVPKLTPELNEVRPLSFTRAFAFSYFHLFDIQKSNNILLDPLPVTRQKKRFPRKKPLIVKEWKSAF